MLGSTALQAVLGSGVDNTNHEAVRKFIRAATAEGLALLLVHPQSKVPADMRTVRKRNADDKAAREAAKAEGRADWQRVKSPSGLALATTNATTLLKYLDEYVKVHGDDVPVNLAIELGESKLVVVDCDTAAQREAFLEAAGAPADLPPTVVTPGQQDSEGNWAHSDGGHYYFTLGDDVEMPTNIGAYTWGSGDGAFAILWHRRYVLIPPSTRPEGRYELVGRDYPLPEWIHEKVTEKAEARAARFDNHARGEGSDMSEAIDAWAETISWREILEPQGWTPTARPDACGCEVWTAPGVHASPKSATAHDPGCSLGRYTEVNAPLHIWTDHDVAPFDAWVEAHGTTLSKLQAVAASEYEGSTSKAMDELGLIPEPIDVDIHGNPKNLADDDDDNAANLAEDLETPSSPSADETETPSSTDAEPDTQPVDNDGDDDADPLAFSAADLDAAPFPDEVDADDGVINTGVDGVPLIAPFDYWRNVPPPEYIVEDLIEHRGLSCIIGPPGAGKSAVALDMACSIATGRRWQGRSVLQTKVLYLPGEGLSGAVQRIASWEQAHETEVGEQLLIGDSIIQLGAKKEAWGALMGVVSEQGIGLIIFDTFARMSQAVEENSATEVGRAVKRFDHVRDMTGAGVLIVHHTAKGSDSARGSSALNGALDSELLVRPGSWLYEEILETVPDELPKGKKIEVHTSKQKNAPQMDEALPLLISTWEPTDSLIVTGPTGTVDPLASSVVLASPVPEPVVETAIRIRRHLERFTQQGLTRTDLAAQIRPDAHTLRRDDAPKLWKAKIAEAIDRALRYDLIETLTGTASGGRYIPSVGTIADARSRAAQEVIGDDDND